MPINAIHNTFSTLMVVGLCAFANPTHAQTPARNLVVNPGFENLRDPGLKPDPLGPVGLAEGWSSPNNGDPKLYGLTSNGYVFDEFGISWKFRPHSGKYVAGIYAYGTMPKSQVEQRDYLQGRLIEPLTPGKKYYFSFFVHYHCEGTNNIGISFFSNIQKFDSLGVLPLKPMAFQREVTPYTGKKTWTMVLDSFVATEPHTHFVIGNFFPNNQTKVQGGHFNHQFAYIDDVRVVEADVLQQLTTAKLAMENNRNSNEPKFAIRNIYFRFDSDEILPEYLPQLDSLCRWMLLDDKLQLQINGHASSEGEGDYNKDLSRRRAEAVENYLRNRGVPASSIQIRYYGAFLPAVENTDEQNRSKNRRVELGLVQ